MRDGGAFLPHRKPALLIAATTALTLRSFLLPFARRFRQAGWRVDGLASGVRDCSACVEAFDAVWDIQWSRNALDVRNIARAPDVVRHVVAQGGYDIVHVHTPVAAAVLRFALRARHNGRPRVVYTAHGFHFHEGGSPLRNALFRRLERRAARWTDRLIVINKEDAAAARRYAFVSEARLRYCPGIGVDTAALRPDAVSDDDVRRLRAELGLAPTDSLFTMVAEFNPGKRHDVAVRALARLERPHVHLALAGIGPRLEATKQLATSLGVAHQTHFLGYRSDVSIILRSSTAAVLPSEREGLPRSLLEAMSLGVPVIASDIRGVREFTETGGGVLVPVGNAMTLAVALAHLLDNPVATRAMGMQARARAADFDLSLVLAFHEQLYDELLEMDDVGPIR